MSLLAALGGAAKRSVELRDKAYDEESDTRKLTLKSNLEEAKRIRNENRTKKETYKNLYGGLYGVLQNDDLVFDIMKRGTANAQAFLTNIETFEQKTGSNLANIEEQKKLGMIPDDYAPQQNLPNVDDFIQNNLMGKAGQITPPKDASGMEAAIKRHFGTTSPEVMSFQTLGQVASLTGQSREEVAANLEGSRVKEVIRDGVTVSLPRDELTVIERATSLKAARNLQDLQSQEHPVFNPDTGAVVTGKKQTWEELQAFIRTYGQPRQIVAAYVNLEKQKGAPNALAKIWTQKVLPATNRINSAVAMALNMDITTVNGEQKFALREGQENIVEELRAGAATFLTSQMIASSYTIYNLDPQANIAYQKAFVAAASDTSVRSALMATAIEKDRASGLKVYTNFLKTLGYSENSLQKAMGGDSDKSTGQVGLENMITPSLNAYLGPKGTNAKVKLNFYSNLEQIFDSQLKSGAIVGPDNMDANKLFQNEDFGKSLGLPSSIRNAVNNNLIDKEFVDKIITATANKPLNVEDIKKGTEEADSSAEEARRKALPRTSAMSNALQRAERQAQRAEQPSTETGIDTRTERMQRQEEEPAMLEAQNFVSEDAELVKALNSRSMLVDFAKRAASLEEGLKNFLQRPPPRGSGIMRREQKSTAYDTEIDNEIEQFAKKYNLSDEIRNKLSTKLKKEIATSNFKDAIEFKSGFDDLSDQEASQVAMLGIKLQNEDGTFKNVEHLRRELSEMTGSSSTSVLAADRN